MKESKLVTLGYMPAIVQMRYDGKTLQQIVDWLKSEHGYETSVQIVSHQLLKLKDKMKEETKQQQPLPEKPVVSPQDILYENRKEVIRMKKEFYLNSSIAKAFGVEESDVEEFLSKRKKLSSQDHRDIIYKHSQGYTPQEIADEYGVNVKSVELILSKNNVLTTSPLVMSKLNNKNEEKELSVKTELYDPSIAKNFIKFINNIELRYNMYKQDVEKFDNVRNDIYHTLELNNVSQEEQLELLDKIKQTSIERRELKDFIEVVTPIIEFLQDENNKKVIATFSNIAGRVVNNMKKMSNRVYFIREDTSEDEE